MTTIDARTSLAADRAASSRAATDSKKKAPRSRGAAIARAQADADGQEPANAATPEGLKEKASRKSKRPVDTSQETFDMLQDALNAKPGDQPDGAERPKAEEPPATDKILDAGQASWFSSSEHEERNQAAASHLRDLGIDSSAKLISWGVLMGVVPQPAQKAAKVAGTRGPGVIDTILELAQRPEGVSLPEFLVVAAQRFPERQADAMTQTWKVQVGSRIQKERNEEFKIEKTVDETRGGQVLRLSARN